MVETQEEIQRRADSVAEQRRQTRQRKILENSERRMARIKGVEGRFESAVDSVIDQTETEYHTPKQEKAEEAKEELCENNNVRTPSSEMLESPTSETGFESVKSAFGDNDDSTVVMTRRKPRMKSVSSPTHSDILGSPDWRKAFVDKRQPLYYERKRLWATFVAGFLMRVLAGLGFIHYVLIPWFMLELAIEMILLKIEDRYPYPAHGHIMDILISLRFGERIVYAGGHLAERLTFVFNDTVSMVMGFIFWHLMTEAAAGRAVFSFE